MSTLIDGQTALVRAQDLSPAEMKAMRSEAEKREPELWKRCYPRIYEPYKSNLYCSPKEVSWQMFIAAKKVDLQHLGQSEQYEIIWASLMAERRVPTYWVAPDLLEAVMRTVPPIELDWYNMKLPHEAAAFMLPKDSITHSSEGSVQYVSYSRHLKGKWTPSLAREGPRLYSSENGALLLFSKTEQYLTHYNIPHDEFPTVNLGAIDEAISRHESEVHSSGWLTASMDKEDTKVGTRVAHLIFGLLLLMLRKPELVTDGKLINKIKGNLGQAPKEFWSPSVIGQHYQIRRVPGPGLGGTHASPRGHWVRGFWRDQHYGAAKAMTKEVWIEPYWRGGDEDE